MEDDFEQMEEIDDEDFEEDEIPEDEEDFD